jgi:hypothetical protein
MTYRHALRVDERRNVLYMTQAGHAEAADMLRMRDEYVKTLKRMRPGFVLVNDQREVESFSDGALELGKELVELTGAHGVATVVRVLPASLLPRTRISRVLVSADAPYRTVRVATLEEAESAVAEHLSRST